MKIGLILQTRYPLGEYILVGNPTSQSEYDESLTWVGKDPKPTWSEVTSQWESVEQEVAINAIKLARQAEYTSTADPLFFKFQAGEATEKDWLDARASVSANNPYPSN